MSPLRVKPLDGLRGIAALVVVTYHAAMTGPLANAIGSGANEPSTSAASVLGYTPLHFFWDGTFAVYVFFGLSGYVLTLQMGGQPRKSWAEYYPHRLLRLYLPVWGAVVFSGLLAVAVPRVIPEDGTPRLRAHSGTGFAHGGATAAALLTQSRVPWLDSPLWSLKWEIIFSLVLPVYIFAGRQTRPRGALVGLIGIFGLEVVAFHLGDDSMIYLPMFAVGVLLAFHRTWIAEIASQLSTRTWVEVGGLAVLAESASWICTGRHVAGYTLAGTKALQVLSVVLLLVIATECGGSHTALTTRPVQWLGKRSFALYLVHDPIVTSAAIFLGPHPLAVLATSLPISLVVAELMGRWVEVPANRFAAQAGSRVARNVSAGRHSTVPEQRPPVPPRERATTL